MSKWAVAAVFLGILVPFPAAAGSLHQICYRDQTNPLEPNLVSARCRSDLAGVGCTVQVPAGFTLLSSAVSTQGRSEVYRVPSATATYHLGFQFTDGTFRGCTVEMGIPPSPWAHYPQGDLVGYTTDDSGLLMTGVWSRSTSPSDYASPWIVNVEVPYDFVVTGGGAAGAEVPNGAMLSMVAAQTWSALYPVWSSMTEELQSADPYLHESRAIGIKVEGLTYSDLTARMSITYASSYWASGRTPHAAMSVAAPAGWLAVGGGASTNDATPRFLTASAPIVRQVYPCLKHFCRPGLVVDGWQARSKDHVVSAPGSVAVQLVLIAPELIIFGHRYRVDVAAWAATSSVAQHPSVSVTGAPGTYALTGVGAYVDWEPYGWAGNLLWKVLPVPNIAGAEVASKDHTIVSPATVTAYAVGARLVLIPD
jgi:hypothetical protein